MQSKRTLIVALVLSIPLFQNTQSAIAKDALDLTGRILGQNYSPVAGARISLVGKSGTHFETDTDQQGRFRLTNLAPGVYHLNIRAEGYSHYYVKDFIMDRRLVGPVTVTLRSI